MKMTTLKSVAIAVGLASSAFGQATSPVVGYVTENLTPGFNPIGVTLHSKVLTTGTFTGELEDTTADFTTVLDDFAGTTYLLEVTSGDQNGAVAIIDSATATTLTLAEPLNAGTATYQIREAATLNDLFGGQLNGGNALNANTDVVFVQRLDGSGFDQYFFSTFNGANEFRISTAPFGSPAKPAAVFYPDALFIQVSPTPTAPAEVTTDVVISGALKTTPTVVMANNGFNFIAAAGPVGLTLGNSGFDAFLSQTPAANGADMVFLNNGNGFTQYFNSTFNGGAWRLTTAQFGAPQDDVELSSGMFIQRAGDDTGGVATLPDFYAGL